MFEWVATRATMGSEVSPKGPVCASPEMIRLVLIIVQ